MVKVKKDTINRIAFESEMESLKGFVMQNPTDPRTVVQAINNAVNKLTEYIDEKDADPFHIPDWINQDVTVSMSATDIGDCYGF